MADLIVPRGEAGLREELIAFLEDRYWQKPGSMADEADALLAGPLAQIQSDRTRLEAENERLRAALLPFTAEQLIGLVLMPDEGRLGSDPPARPAYVHHRPLFDAARAALAQPQPEERGPLPLDPSPQGEGGGE